MSLVIGTTDRVETPHPQLPGTSLATRTVHLNGSVTPSAYFRWKPWVDRTLAVLLLVPGLLLMSVAALAVRLTSRGPVIYRHRRVGRGGRLFWFYKLRTMRHDAENGEPLWATADDGRVTRVGRWLRRFHLDELPQLFNVLKGEMALVGPRPERPEFVQVLLGSVAGYRHRMAVLPGVTGLAQLNLPPDTELCCVCRKVVLDLDYVENATLGFDLRILACTMLNMLKLPWIDWPRLLRVSRRVAIVGCPPQEENNGRPTPAGPVSPASLRCPAMERATGGNDSTPRLTATTRFAVDPSRKPKPR